MHDIKEGSAKPNDWKKRKMISLKTAYAFQRIGNPKAGRMFECGGYLEFKRFISDNSMRLKTGNFCQVRLCPLCNWRRSRKMFAQISKIMAGIENYEYVFLTLTCKNVDGSALNNQIDILFKAIKLLCLRKRFKDAVHGWIRCFEVTYNWSAEEYHPHFHCILAVKEGYFTSGLYLDQEEWCRLWQSCMGVDYVPIVDVRKLEESEKGMGKEVAEVAKYTVKSASIMADLRGVSGFNQEIQDEAKKLSDKLTENIVFTLDAALKNRRLIGFGGIFRNKHRELNLNTDDTDLIHAGASEERREDMYVIEKYGWAAGYKNYMMLEEDNYDGQDDNDN